jgi:hypothetical protein
MKFFHIAGGEAESRIQNPEFRSQKKRETESVEAVSAFSFWILDSGF